jgi:agmatine deiminase
MSTRRHLAPEFGPIERQWLLWPVRTDNWREGAAPVQAAFAQLAEVLLAFDPVTVGTPREQLLEARRRLPAGVEVVSIESDDAWLRDTGPSFTVGTDGSRLAVDWRFNAWGGEAGGLYADWSRDARVAARVAQLTGWPSLPVDLICEGGAIHGDGEGTGLSTESCLLNANRNGAHSRAYVEGVLREWVGFERLIWLPQGLAGDETDGHVDNLACFIAPGRVALAWTEDEEDPHFEACQAAMAVLAASRDAQGRAFEVLRIPLPEGIPPMTETEASGVIPREGSQPRLPGMALTASYVNAVFASGALVIPEFGVASDRTAAEAWATALPGRQIVGVPAREILLGGGGLHCVVMGEPGVG